MIEGDQVAGNQPALNGEAEPCGESTASGHAADRAAECANCGEVEPTERGQCPQCGRFLSANTVNLKHGLRATRETMLQQRGAAEALAERQQEIESDLGGGDTLSRVHRDAIRDLLRLELVADFLFEKLVTEGPLTGKGRTRAALSAYLTTSDRLYRLRQMVGLERRQKTVDPIEAVRQAVEEANAEKPAAEDRPQATSASDRTGVPAE